MIGGIQNIWRIPELRQRILFTFSMLAVYRIGCVVVTPGINSQVIRDFFAGMAFSVILTLVFRVIGFQGVVAIALRTLRELARALVQVTTPAKRAMPKKLLA